MHHSVRKAKHFKLQYDEEIGYYVDDEFSGTAKRPIKRDWDDGYWKWSLNGIPNVDRYLTKRLGDNWDDVWSDICRIAKSYKGLTAERLRDRFKQSVARNIEVIDGVVCEYTEWRGLQAVWHLGFYVDPSTKVLCQVAARPKVKCDTMPRSYDSHGVRQTVKVVDGVEYVYKHIYNKRKELVDKAWHKPVEYAYTEYESVRKRVFGEYREYNYRTRQYYDAIGWHITYAYETVQKVGKKLVTMSKKDIRKFKLNEKEQDNG